MIVLALAFAACAFALSASAGLGGSLILVPSLCLLLGTKEGIAHAALLLAFNNVAKVVAYRKSIRLKPVMWILLFTVLGTVLGASLLVSAPEHWVSTAVFVGIVLSLLFERQNAATIQLSFAPVLAFFAGAASGFSGTSGPLKGVALRNLKLERQFFVGAASAVSLTGDTAKVAVFFQQSILSNQSFILVGCAIPLMIGATLLGRRINSELGERGYAILFWLVMTGYSTRLLFGR